MKKTKMLALTLVVAIMLAGAGYAAWTDQIKTTTVIETGEFKVDLGNTFSRVWIFDEEGENWIAKKDTDNAYAISPDVDKNTVKFEFKNMYPGTEAFTQWYARNNGTINAVVEKVNCVFETTMDVDDIRTIENELLVRGSIQIRDKDNNRIALLKGIPEGTKLGELDSILKDRLVGQMIKPGETILFAGDTEGEALGDFMYFTVPTDLEGNEGENEIIKLEITIDFIQYNLSENYN